MNNYKSKTIPLALIGTLVIIGGLIFYLSLQFRNPLPVACTQETKICSDGSSVSRSGPKCEFAECPIVKPLEITIYCINKNCASQQVFAGAGTLIQGCYRNLAECESASAVCDKPGCETASSSLKLVNDTKQNISYRYQEKLTTIYIQAQDWPPTVVVSNKAFSCNQSASNSGPAGPQSTQITKNGQTYCVQELVEGAAGTIYTNYNYTTVKNSKFVTITFVLRAPQCLNYDNPKQTECTQERQLFNATDLVVPIIESLKFTQSKDDLIKVSDPQSGQLIQGPLKISGQARGSWYFEAVFPIILLDGQGKEIARTQGRATSDWTTTNFVPFEASLTFTRPNTATGTLVFSKDNPSGLPENADMLEVPIRFR